MKKILFPAITMICLFAEVYGQDSVLLHKTALQIDKQDSLSMDIYEVISMYQLFIIGEGHGTKEPARFVQSLAELFLNKGSRVQIGLEIPSDQMKKYLSNPNDSSVFESDFFINKSYDGRACFAWANLIARLSGHPNVEFFFYDVNIGEFKNFDERDSLMYLKIKKRIQLHPDWKTIVLGGNIHAMLKPYDGKPKLAFFLRYDKDLQIEKKLLSIDHRHAVGTYWDNSNKMLQVFQSDESQSIFATAVNYENYLFLNPQEADKIFNAIYFTRKQTASTLVSQK
jgi:hypothetical protein